MKGIKIQSLGNKHVLVAAIKFSELDPIVRFTKREPSDWNPYEFNDNSERSDQEYYQRLTDSDRVKNIEKFIEEVLLDQLKDGNTISTLFPSSVIISMDLEELMQEDETVKINPPKENHSCLIVDGQHRFAGMRKLLEKHGMNQSQESIYITREILNYNFNCTLLINFDIWEQAQLFANVNFNQKRVNKSLYFDIFGSTPESERIDRNSGIYLAHSLAQYLNNSNNSPMKGFIKMLGTGSGYFSQAFLVEAILAHFRSKGVWADIDDDYKKKGSKHKMLPKVFVAYFNSIKGVFNEHWPKDSSQKYESILCKTTGIGALIRLLGYIYLLLQRGTYPNENRVDFEVIERKDLEEVFTRIFLKIKAQGNNLFGKDSIYAGSAGSGLQSKLYKFISQELGLFKKDS